MTHGKHNYVMIGLVAIGAVLFLTGNAGGLVFLLWPLACMGMMFMMMRGMSGMQNGPDHTHDDASDHTHEDGLSHSHR